MTMTPEAPELIVITPEILTLSFQILTPTVTIIPSEKQVAAAIRPRIRQVLVQRKVPITTKEDAISGMLGKALSQVGRFYRHDTCVPIFFRNADRKVYDIDSRPESPFGRLVTYLTDLSPRMVMLARCVDRLRASVAETAQTVHVHALAYNSQGADVIAANDFGGGMWYRRRYGQWEWRPNGSEGILFWTPPEFVEPWTPAFTPGESRDEEHLGWLVDLPHFADDILTAQDQRMLFRACMLAPFFPAYCMTRPVQVHLGLAHQQQHDTGKTMAGKILGALWAGSHFQPTPVKRSTERGEEDLQLTIMNQPFVLLDNVDTDIPWLNDFLCTYATGARPTRRKHYENTTLVSYEYRGLLVLTSRKARFNRADVASRTIPFRFRPITAGERKTEPEILGPVLERRGKVWAGILALIARVQDALPELAPPATARLADFDALGWCIAKVYGEEKGWEQAMTRLQAAQAGFALEDEALIPILSHILEGGDVPEQPTSEFWDQVTLAATELNIEGAAPRSAAICTQQLNELRGVLEARLDVKIYTRTLHGHTLIKIVRGASWQKPAEPGRGQPG